MEDALERHAGGMAMPTAPGVQRRGVKPGDGGVSRRTALCLLALILAGGAALRLWMLAHDVPTMDSDEATFGLMALHMLHGQWTAVMWGQTYMGSLESMLLVPFLWLFGTNNITLHLAPLLLGLGFVASAYALSAWLISRRVGLIAAALLAIGPPFFVVLSVRTFGGYVETLLFGNLLLLLALRGGLPGGRTWWRVALTGLLAGVALWTDFLIVPFLLAMGAIFVGQRRRDLLGRNGVLLAGATLLGVLPIILFEILSGGGTARAIATSTLSGTGTPGAPAATHPVPLAALHNPLHELLVSLPILLGGGLGGTQSTGLSMGDYLALASRYPLVYAVNLVLVAGALGLIACVLVRALRHGRVLRIAPGGQSLARAQLLAQYEAAVLLICACYGGAVLIYRDMNFAAPRYLLPFFIAAPLVVRQADLVIQALWSAGGRSWRGSRALIGRLSKLTLLPTVCVVGLFGVVILWNLAGDVTLRPIQTAALDNSVWVYGDDAPLLNALRAHQTHTVITDNYWIGMRVTFESGETVIPVIADADGNLGLNRYPPYVAEGLRDNHPAFVELVGTPGADQRLRRWQAGQYPGYQTQRIGPYLVFLPG